MAYDPVPLDLRVWRNGDYVEEFFVAMDFGPDGTPIDPIDLTGWTAEMQVRLYGLAGGAALLSLATVTSEGQGIRLLDPTAGVLRIWIARTTLEALPNTGKAGLERTFAYDLVLIDPTGIRSVYATGAFIVPPGVNR